MNAANLADRAAREAYRALVEKEAEPFAVRTALPQWSPTRAFPIIQALYESRRRAAREIAALAPASPSSRSTRRNPRGADGRFIPVEDAPQAQRL